MNWNATYSGETDAIIASVNGDSSIPSPVQDAIKTMTSFLSPTDKYTVVTSGTDNIIRVEFLLIIGFT